VFLAIFNEIHSFSLAAVENGLKEIKSGRLKSKTVKNGLNR
jgi:hypothetical protein